MTLREAPVGAVSMSSRGCHASAISGRHPHDSHERPARLLLFALFVLVAHAAPLADRVIDGAGISFAYARYLTDGARLVPQPRVEPVEGWTMSGPWLLSWDPSRLADVLSGATGRLAPFVCLAIGVALIRAARRRSIEDRVPSDLAVTVARKLMYDGRAFHDYVFDDMRPTFIRVNGSWAGWAALHKDPRLVRDYMRLGEEWEGREPGEPRSGDYVRRDAADGGPGIQALRATFTKRGLDRSLT